jgi:hypothetical protein
VSGDAVYQPVLDEWVRVSLSIEGRVIETARGFVLVENNRERIEVRLDDLRYKFEPAEDLRGEPPPWKVGDVALDRLGRRLIRCSDGWTCVDPEVAEVSWLRDADDGPARGLRPLILDGKAVSS